MALRGRQNDGDGDGGHPGHGADGLAVVGEGEEAGDVAVAVGDRQDAAAQRGVGRGDDGDGSVVGLEHDLVTVGDAERGEIVGVRVTGVARGRAR